jgi:cysteine desulfurase
MAPYWTDRAFNPSSSYPESEGVRDAIEFARASLADLLGASVDAIIFTSGGTETNNWVLREGWRSREPGRDTVVISTVEHPAILETAEALKNIGARVVLVPVDGEGVLRLDELDKAVDARTALVSVMLANNEVGTLQPIVEAARIAHHKGAWMHTDASQAVGKVPVDVKLLDVDFLTVAGHKLYAPKGIGALYLRPGIGLPPMLTGGGQECGRRSGTEPTPLIVGLGRAAQLAKDWLAGDGSTRQARLRDALELDLLRHCDQLVTFGKGAERLPNTLAFANWYIPGAMLLASCPEIRAGTGSACHRPDDIGSPTLRAMGVERELARGLVRVSLGRSTSEADLDIASTALKRAIAAATAVHK